MVSVHKPVHSKITLTYSLTWQADRCTSQRMAFKARPFPSLCSSFLCAYSSKKLQERASTKKKAMCTDYCRSLINCTCRAWAYRRSAYAQLSPLYPSLYPYVTHVINYSRPSPAFPYWKRRKAGRGLGRGYSGLVSVILQVIVDSIVLFCYLLLCSAMQTYMYIEDGSTLTQKS